MALPYIGIFFLAMIKFIFAPVTAIIAIPKITWLQNYILCISGAMAGATFFYFSSVFLINKTQERRAKKGIVKKKFTRKNKLVIKTKNSIGLIGLAFLTASFISIPLGSIITAKFYRHKKKTIFIIYFAIALVGAISTSLTYALRL
jgi:hypothetical protein